MGTQADGLRLLKGGIGDVACTTAKMARKSGRERQQERVPFFLGTRESFPGLRRVTLDFKASDASPSSVELRKREETRTARPG